MSHIAEIKLNVTDLPALRTAAQKLGLEFRAGQKTFKWYGTDMGGQTYPAGFGPKDLGKCEHAISVPGNDKAYEIGIAARRDGKPGYILLWDSWCGGMGLADKVGPDTGLLQQRYAIEAARNEAGLQGWECNEVRLPNGNIELEVVQL